VIWLIGAVGLAFVLLWGGVKIEHAGKVAAQAEAEKATSANAALAADCKGKIAARDQLIKDLADNDTKRTAINRAALAATKKAQAAHQSAIERDKAAAKDATPLTAQQECDAARATLRDYAKEMAK